MCVEWEGVGGRRSGEGMWGGGKAVHNKNTSIQIYGKFHLIKMKIFR